MSANVSSWFFKYGVFLPVVTARGERVFHHLKHLEQSQFWSDEAIRELQERKLSALLRHAQESVPFYRARRDASQNANATAWDQLHSLAGITKHDLIHSNVDLRSEARLGPQTVKTTGGSTGQAVTVRKSRQATALEIAANWRGFRWEGIDIGDRQARFWGVPVTTRGRLRAQAIDWVSHRRRYSAFKFAETDIAGYVADLERFRPHYFYGYASMLRCLADYLVDRNRTLRCDLRAVISTSEPLTPPDRRLFERAFAAPVFNEYGCGELGTIAHECERGGLHVHAENLLLEIQPPEPGAAADAPGEVVVTELNNLAMPLIRYRLGDFAAWSTEPCACGRTLPTLREVFGRSYDMVRNREGQRLHGEFFMYIVEDARQRGLGIDAFQLVQHDYDNVTVRVVPSEGYGVAAEEFVRSRIRAGLGETVDVAFERVAAISRERSGKMRLVIGMPQK
jgi:phenylacetate-CoA ligase